MGEIKKETKRKSHRGRKGRWSHILRWEKTDGGQGRDGRPALIFHEQQPPAGNLPGNAAKALHGQVIFCHQNANQRVTVEGWGHTLLVLALTLPSLQCPILWIWWSCSVLGAETQVLGDSVYRKTDPSLERSTLRDPSAPSKSWAGVDRLREASCFLHISFLGSWRAIPQVE